MNRKRLAVASHRKPGRNDNARPGPAKRGRGETDGAIRPKAKKPQIDPKKKTASTRPPQCDANDANRPVKKASYGYLLKAILQAWYELANYYIMEEDDEEKKQKELWCQQTAAIVRGDPLMMMEFGPLLDNEFFSHYALSHLLKTLGDDAVMAVTLFINGLIE